MLSSPTKTIQTLTVPLSVCQGRVRSRLHTKKLYIKSDVICVDPDCDGKCKSTTGYRKIVYDEFGIPKRDSSGLIVKKSMYYYECRKCHKIQVRRPPRECGPGEDGDVQEITSSQKRAYKCALCGLSKKGHTCLKRSSSVN